MRSGPIPYIGLLGVTPLLQLQTPCFREAPHQFPPCVGGPGAALMTTPGGPMAAFLLSHLFTAMIREATYVSLER